MALQELLIILINILLDPLEPLVHKATPDLKEKREILVPLELLGHQDIKESPALMELLVRKDYPVQEAMMVLLELLVPLVTPEQRENLELMEAKA